jgi:hypothetical protein
MQEAKSIYLGGDIISAIECDYPDTKAFGLKCPFCDEAVFLRAGEKRKPHFSHYSKTPETIVCENRSLTKEGREVIERAIANAKNQRLALYNRHLWELYIYEYKDGWAASRECQILATKLFGDRFIDSVVKKLQASWKEGKKTFHNILNEVLNHYTRANIQEKERIEAEAMQEIVEKVPVGVKEEVEEQLRDCLAFGNYFRYDCNHRLHREIVGEIFDFLCTKTSKYFWRKATKRTLLTIASEYKATGGDWKKLKEKEILELLPLSELLSFIQNTIVSVHWIDNINILCR